MKKLKLSINRTTVRALTSAPLSEVVGGGRTGTKKSQDDVCDTGQKSVCVGCTGGSTGAAVCA